MPGKFAGFGPFKGNDFAFMACFMAFMFTIILIGNAETVNLPPDTGTAGGGNGGAGGTGATVTKTVTLKNENGHTSEGGTTDISIDVTDVNAIALNITLTWTDDIGSNDEFGLTLTNDSGELASDSSTSGSIALAFELEGGGDPGTGPLVGSYTVTVEAIKCPGLITPLPVDRDTGNDWSLEVTMTTVVEEGG